MTEPIDLPNKKIEQLSILTGMIERAHSTIIMVVALEAFNEQLTLGDIDEIEINVQSYLARLEQSFMALMEYITRASEGL